jgi:hypothetical protein
LSLHNIKLILFNFWHSLALLHSELLHHTVKSVVSHIITTLKLNFITVSSSRRRPSFYLCCRSKERTILTNFDFILTTYNLTHWITAIAVVDSNKITPENKENSDMGRKYSRLFQMLNIPSTAEITIIPALVLSVFAASLLMAATAAPTLSSSTIVTTVFLCE